MLLVLFSFAEQLRAQVWVDTLYAIHTETNVIYGTGIDFAGNQRLLTCDISFPTNDTPPECGRPLLIAVHGGAFLAGTKNDANTNRWMLDFAKRGYVSATVNYRLGMFQSHTEVHCNASDVLNLPWDCSNLQDTAEWYRASYRAMQDVQGAIRFLMTNKDVYKIDPRNVFLIGESAGGFTVLQAAFLDTLTEKHPSCYEIPDALAPHTIYESRCIQRGAFDTNIASMDLSRPDLGGVHGTLHPDAPSYIIKGVANFYGAVLRDLFSHSTYAAEPTLYLFHQPNDLIVPIEREKVLEGFTQFMHGFGCGDIINRPYTYGSLAIKKMMDSLGELGIRLPKLTAEFTTNTTDAWGQVLNPALTGHAIDNYWNRTKTVAELFAKEMDTSDCQPLTVNTPHTRDVVTTYDKTTRTITLTSSAGEIHSVEVYDIAGRIVSFGKRHHIGSSVMIEVPREYTGVYFVRASTDDEVEISKLMIE